MPTWEQVQVGISKKKVDCSKQNCPGIDALPTIVLKTNTKNTEYQGAREKDAIEEFVNRHVTK